VIVLDDEPGDPVALPDLYRQAPGALEQDAVKDLARIAIA